MAALFLSKSSVFDRHQLLNSAQMVCYDAEKYADEVINMKRELPKNVRQIGNVSDSSKIYVEDYVDTYFNQLCEKANQSLLGAFLIGEMVQEGEEDYTYIYGAVQMKEVQQKGKEVSVSDETWKDACEMTKKYFGNAEILGWFLTSTGLVLESNHNLQKIHQKLFSREKSILILKEAQEKEERYFIHKFRNLMEIQGHYIYYEKNNEMQDYMIATRKENGMTPSEVIEDKAIKNFRTLIQEKMEKKEKRESSRMVYAVSTFLVLVMAIVGVVMVNDYDRIRTVQAVLEQFWDKEKPLEESVPVLGEVTTPGEKEESPEETPEEIPEKTPEVEEPAEEDTTTENTLPPRYADGVYIVEKGDTLAIISRKVYGDLDHIDAICRMNGLKNGNLILVGQKLVLP